MLLLPKLKALLRKLFLTLKKPVPMRRKLRRKQFPMLKKLPVKPSTVLKKPATKLWTMQKLLWAKLKTLPKMRLKMLWVKLPMQLKKLPTNWKMLLNKPVSDIWKGRLKNVFQTAFLYRRIIFFLADACTPKKSGWMRPVRQRRRTGKWKSGYVPSA